MMLSNPDPRTVNVCNAKRRFHTQEQAEHGAEHSWKKRRVRMKVYECPVCGGWHMTHKRRRKRGR